MWVWVKVRARTSGEGVGSGFEAHLLQVDVGERNVLVTGEEVSGEAFENGLVEAPDDAIHGVKHLLITSEDSSTVTQPTSY